MTTDAEKRKQRNLELLERMKNPEDRLTDQVPMATRWYPPRKIIEKDPEAIKKIFDQEEK